MYQNQASNNPATMSPEQYKISHDAMMRSDRKAASDVFEHARSVGDLETVVLAYYAMAGPVTVEGTQAQVEEDLSFIRDFMTPDVFTSLEDMVPYTKSLQSKGLLKAWTDQTVQPAAIKADIPIRAPGGAMFLPGGAKEADVVIASTRYDEQGNPIPQARLEQMSTKGTHRAPTEKKKSGGGGAGILLGLGALVAGGLLVKKYF